MLKLLTERKEINIAYRLLRDIAYESGEKLDRRFNYRGGEGGGGVVSWHPKYRFWSFFKRRAISRDSWNIFGIESAEKITTGLSLTCEINTPLVRGIWSTAGAFACDSRGRRLLIHNGSIGGGQLGVGKTAFWRLFPGKVHSVESPKKKSVNVAVVAVLDEPDVLPRLAQFVWMVAWMKAKITNENLRQKIKAINAES